MAGLVVHAVHTGHGREQYDYSTGLIDMVIFDVGCLYFTAGWYVDSNNDEEPLSPKDEPRSNAVELRGVQSLQMPSSARDNAGTTGLSIYAAPV